MPLPMSSFAITEKNKLSSSSPFVIILQITIPGNPATVVYVANNNEDITWNGHTYYAVPMEINEISESSKNETPSVEIKIGNANRAIENYLQTYDSYTKNNGYTPITVVIMVINTGNLSNTTPEVQYQFNLQQPKTNAQWATFTLGAPSPYCQRFPALRILKNQCQVLKFKDVECGYTGSATTCDRTLLTCRSYGNSQRFKGFPGVVSSGNRI